MRIKQSVCYPMMKPPGMPLDAFASMVAAMGYSAIELWGRGDDFLDVVEIANRHDLVIASMIGHNSLGVGLNDASQHPRIEAELRESIDLAARYGIPGLICFSGNRRLGVSEDEAVANTVIGLRRIAPYAEACGVNLNMELLNSKVDHAGYQCDHTAWGVAVCEQVASPNVKLLYDIYHMQIMEGDIIRTISDTIRWIGHFHTAGVPGRREIGQTQELNYGAICRAIADLGYNLYVGHEFRPVGDLAESLRVAYSICDQGS